MTRLIIGNKKNNMSFINSVIDFFECNTRFNMSLPSNITGTKYNRIILNNHIFHSLNLPLQTNINKYNGFYEIDIDHIKKFYQSIKKYTEIKIQPYRNITDPNEILKKLQCPYNFDKLPRVGIQEILYQLSLNNGKPFIIGFTLTPNIYEEHNFVVKPEFAKGHSPENEKKILIWLHHNKYVDATLCMITNTENDTLLLDCSNIYPTLECLNILLTICKTAFLQNYDKDEIKQIIHGSKIFFSDTTSTLCFM